ncbi:hypothetical protein GGH94_001911 [Coemansia aciculifera]|uniref:Large ribosomal subunit protein eL14 domain-containing protein n=1 Tax=Coemansia aciculifera TaxID=417176 RepID=A0A9W8M784_9FUNG|nr:hypothetical protein GGH94_001911 [Coemansia aciculifera]
MARRKNTAAAVTRPAPVQPRTCSAGCGFCGWALRRIVLAYILFVTLFTCPTSPDHFICRTESLVRSTLVTPVHNYLLTTETGTRVHTAYNAHLVPFYEKHAVPIVDAAYGFVSDTAKPALCKATAPVSDAVMRVVEPHREKVVAAYDRYLGPAIDMTSAAVSQAVNGVVVPTVTKVGTWVVPRVSSAVSDYIVPFYRDTVMPRWNEQVRPAVCRYSKIVVQYTRSEVLPAIADGAGRAYVVSRDFATVHIVPHAKRTTVYTYVFLRKHILPPIRRVYDQNLKEYVDRVVPWEQVNSVCGGVWVFVRGFAEEFYFMCYTIATGDEHPVVVARLKAGEKKAGESKVEAKVEDVGQLQGLARKVSGSARQWIQAARGWVGSAKSTYESRMRATVEVQWSQATEVAAVAKSVVAKPYAATSSVTMSASATSASVTSSGTTSAVRHTESLTTEEYVPVVTVEDIVKRPDAHVASFVSVDAEPVVETPVSVTSPVAEPTEESTPAVVYVEEPVAPANVVEEPVVDMAGEALTEQEEQTPDVVAETAEVPVISEAEQVVMTTPSESPVAAEGEPTVEQLPIDLPSVGEIPPVLIPEPVISIVEAPVDIPEPATSVIEAPVFIPEPAFSIIEASVDIPEPVVSIVETPAPIASPAAVIPEEVESVSPTAEHQTSLPAETTDIAPLIADDAASLIYEARDAMAGVLISDDERAVFGDLVNSANDAAGGADRLEQFPSVLNDLEDTHAEETEVPSVAPLAPQTTVPSTASGLVDEDVRKAASNWVKDARESISKELAQERTRAGTLDEIEVAEDTSVLAESVIPVVESIVSETPVKRIPRETTAPVAAEKPVDVPPTRSTAAVPVAKPPPLVEEIIESVKRLKKPVADAGDATTTKGPRKIKKTKKKVQGSFKRLVEVGRVVLITHGEDAGKIATIVDIVDHNRAIVDGPTTDVKRQIIAYKNVVLTDIVVKCLPRTIGTKALAKFLEKEQVVEAWQKTAWAQKLEARKRRANMSDFDRFKLMRLKKQQRDIVNRQSAVLRKERA